MAHDTGASLQEELRQIRRMLFGLRKHLQRPT
jgi:hypothetical protein